MYINRPLIHGNPNKNYNLTTKRQLSIKDSKSSIRIKTLPSQYTKRSSINNKQQHILNLGNSLIGVKDVKEIIDQDMESLIEKLMQLQGDTQEQYKLVRKRHQKFKQNQKNNSLTASKATFSQNRANSNDLNEFLNGEQKNKLSAEMKVSLQQQEQRAFRECQEMLQIKQENNKKVYKRINEGLKLKALQIEEGKLQLMQVQKMLHSRMEEMNKDILKTQNDIKLYRKRQNNKHNLKLQIQEYRKQLQQGNRKLLLSKQQSVKQKNAFIQIQAEEIRLIKLIEEMDYQQSQLEENQENALYKTKMEKLKIKLLQGKQSNEQEIDNYFQEKIQAIIKLRVNCEELDENVAEITQTIEEQQAVIQMLQRRNQLIEQNRLSNLEENQQEQNMTQLYKEKYEKLFLNKYNNNRMKGKNNQSDGEEEDQKIAGRNGQDYRQLSHWQNYKAYLQKILLNEQKLNQFESKVNSNAVRQKYNNLHHISPTSEMSNNKMSSNFDSTSFVITTKPNSQVFYNHRHQGLEKSKSNLKQGNKYDFRNRIQSSSMVNQRNRIYNNNRLLDSDQEDGLGENKNKLINQRQKTKIKSNNSPYHKLQQQQSPYKYPPKINSSLHLKSTPDSLHKLTDKQNLYSKQQKPQIQDKPRWSLPKLVKMEGNLRDQDKIKQQLTKFTKHQYDENIELETVRSSQIDPGEELIEVEFIAKNQALSGEKM